MTSGSMGKLRNPAIQARVASSPVAAVWLVCGLILVAFLINLYVVPDQFIVPSLYVVPVVIAAQRLHARVVALVSGLAIGMYGVNTLLEKPPAVIFPIALLALSAISYFAVSLARQSEKTRASLDETERARRSAEEALAALSESESRYRALARNFPNGAVLLFDRDLRFLLAEGSGLRQAGMSKEQIEGRTLFEIASPAMVERVEPHYRAALDGEHRTYEIEMNGRTYVSHAVPLTDSEGRVLGGLLMWQDISDRKFAERDRARLYHEAQEAIRARDDFLSVAGHELRTPVNAVALLTAGLLRKARSSDRPDGLADGLDRLSLAVDRLCRLTDQVLDVSQIGAGKLVLNREEFDLAELVREVAARFQDGLLASGCAVEMRLDSVRGIWDRARLDQVITNLLANAVKYGGGSPIRLLVENGGGTALLGVRDHGIGIAPEDRARIFERFERAGPARPYSGLGIGLWIVQRIVDAHRGSIEVESEPGEGAEFRVLLPLA